jgi:hypothetical protein
VKISDYDFPSSNKMQSHNKTEILLKAVSPIKNVHRYLNSRKYMQGSVDGLGKYTSKLYKYLLVENKT